MLFFLCDLSGRCVRRFFPHAKDATDAKAEAQERRGTTGRHGNFVEVGQRFLRLNGHVADQPAAANPALASELQSGRHGRGVADPGRSAGCNRGVCMTS